MDLAVGRHEHQVSRTLKEKFNIHLPPNFWKEIAIGQKELFENKLIAVEGIAEAIQSIATPKCVASGSSAERLQHTLKITKLLPYFNDCIFSTDYVKRSKPDPDIYLYAAEKMQTHPSQCIVIEDSLTGIQGGLAAGMTVFAFGGGKHITPLARNKLLKSGAHHFFDCMQELPHLLTSLYSRFN